MINYILLSQWMALPRDAGNLALNTEALSDSGGRPNFRLSGFLIDLKRMENL
jgi:hypothetical protein